MARLQRAGFWFTKQYATFGFQPQGTVAPSPPAQNAFSGFQFFAFTQPYVVFRGLGQVGPIPPPPGECSLLLESGGNLLQEDGFLILIENCVDDGIEYTLSGGGLSELFVTMGGLSASNVSYPINPMSKRTK